MVYLWVKSYFQARRELRSPLTGHCTTCPVHKAAMAFLVMLNGATYGGSLEALLLQLIAVEAQAQGFKD
jgi:hypothetical protein